MTTLLDFAAKCKRAPAAYQRAEKDAVRVAALAVTVATRTELGRATKGSNRLSGVGRKGVKLGVGFGIKGTANPTALVAARGPWQFIERDTAAHTIKPRSRRGRRALASDSFGPVSGVIKHPGTKGKHPWNKGLAAGLPVAQRVGAVEASKALVKVVKG